MKLQILVYPFVDASVDAFVDASVDALYSPLPSLFFFVYSPVFASAWGACCRPSPGPAAAAICQCEKLIQCGTLALGMRGVMSAPACEPAQQALNHDWISKKAPKATNVSLQSNFVDNLRGFRSQNKLKKAALHIIAGQLNEDPPLQAAWHTCPRTKCWIPSMRCLCVGARRASHQSRTWDLAL